MGDSRKRNSKRNGAKQGAPASAEASGRRGDKSKSGGSAPDEITPWQIYAADLLLWYLRAHVGALVLLLGIAPFMREEEASGQAYFDIISIDLGWIGLVLIPALFGVLTLAIMWHVALAWRRKQIIRLAVSGMILSGVFYGLLIWVGLGRDIWQGPGMPGRLEFEAAMASFARGSALIFGGVILGLAGINITTLLKKGSS